MKKVLVSFFSGLCLVSFHAFAAEDGASLYKSNCEMCHGSKFDGDGAVGKNLNPKPSVIKGIKAKDTVQVLDSSKTRAGKDIPMMVGMKGLKKEHKEAIAKFIESQK